LNARCARTRPKNEWERKKTTGIRSYLRTCVLRVRFLIYTVQRRKKKIKEYGNLLFFLYIIARISPSRKRDKMLCSPEHFGFCSFPSGLGRANLSFSFLARAVNPHFTPCSRPETPGRVPKLPDASRVPVGGNGKVCLCVYAVMLIPKTARYIRYN